MAKAAKWRTIDVEGVTYRWYGGPPSIFVRLDREPGHTLVAQFSPRGSRFVVEFEGEDHVCEVFGVGGSQTSKRFVRLAILAGLQFGWEPGAKKGRTTIELVEGPRAHRFEVSG